MNKIKAAVVGVGYLGRFHAQKYAQLPGCELVAVVDGREEIRNAVAGEVGSHPVADYRELLGKVERLRERRTRTANADIGESPYSRPPPGSVQRGQPAPVQRASSTAPSATITP